MTVQLDKDDWAMLRQEAWLLSQTAPTLEALHPRVDAAVHDDPSNLIAFAAAVLNSAASYAASAEESDRFTEELMDLTVRASMFITGNPNLRPTEEMDRKMREAAAKFAKRRLKVLDSLERLVETVSRDITHDDQKAAYFIGALMKTMRSERMVGLPPEQLARLINDMPSEMSDELLGTIDKVLSQKEDGKLKDSDWPEILHDFGEM